MEKARKAKIGKAFQRGDLNSGERHARVTRDDGKVTFCMRAPRYFHPIVVKILVVL